MWSNKIIQAQGCPTNLPAGTICRTLSSFVTPPTTLGDGINLDDDAFIDAAIWFNNRKKSGTTGANEMHVDYANGERGLLIIDYYQPNSTAVAQYTVGRQIDPGQTMYLSESGAIKTNPTWLNNVSNAINSSAYLKRGNDIFDIASNVNGLEIRGEDGHPPVKIKYADGQYYGAWCPPNYHYYCYKLVCQSTCSLQNATTLPGSIAVAYSNRSDNYPYGCAVCPPSTVVNSQSQGCYCITSSAPDGMKIPTAYPAGDLNNTTGNIVALPAAMEFAGLIDDWKTRCIVGNFFVIRGKDIKISNLELDGNIANSMWGRWVADVNGIQLEYSGFKILSTLTNQTDMVIEINNCNVHDFGADGIQVSGTTNGVSLLNSKFERNVRQGFSWTGGKDIYANNCDFSYSATVVNQNPNSTKYLFPMKGNPQSGLDIEPNSPGDYCLDGEFIGCRFIGNSWFEVTNAGYGVTYPTDNIKFISCTFWDFNGDDGVLTSGSNYEFNNCTFRCPVQGNWRGDPQYGTKYINNCIFEDVPLEGTNANNSNQPLFRSLNSSGTLIQNAQFVANDKFRELLNINWINSSQPISKWTILDNCNFLYKNEGNNSNAPLQNIIFRNKNSFITQGPQTCNGRTLHLGNILVEGSSNSCEASELIFDGKIQARVGYNGTNINKDFLYVGKQINLIDDGFATLRCKNGAILRGFNNIQNSILVPSHQLIVGQKGKIYVDEGSGYEGVDALIDGTLAVQNGGYFHQNKLGICPPTAVVPCTLATSLTSKIFLGHLINPTFSPTNVAIPPHYITPSPDPNSPPCNVVDLNDNSLGCDWNGDIIPTTQCILGSHTSYSVQACNPDYSNISINGHLTFYIM